MSPKIYKFEQPHKAVAASNLFLACELFPFFSVCWLPASRFLDLHENKSTLLVAQKRAQFTVKCNFVLVHASNAHGKIELLLKSFSISALDSCE